MRNNTKCHQTIGPRLLKYLALFCMLKSVGAAPFPSSPAAELGAPSSACECSNITDKLEGMAAELKNVSAELKGVTAELAGQAARHASELARVRSEFEDELDGIRQFVGMTPPSSPPPPPSPLLPPPVRDCAASPCVDGYWQTASGISCAVLRAYMGGGAAAYADTEGRLAGESCCQFCPPASPPSSPPPPSPPPSPSPSPPSPSPPPPSPSPTPSPPPPSPSLPPPASPPPSPTTPPPSPPPPSPSPPPPGPSSPSPALPSPSPPPPSPGAPPPPPVRDCAASPCVDGHWENGFGTDCAVLRADLGGGAAAYADAEGRLAGDSCCQFCPPASPPSSPPPSPSPPPPPETLWIKGEPAYPHKTLGQYTMAAGLEFAGAPVYKRGAFSLYKRSNGKWYLSFKDPSDSWAGTVNYALSATNTPFTATWNNEEMKVSPTLIS